MNSPLWAPATIARALRGELPGMEAWRSASFQHVFEQLPAAAFLVSMPGGALWAVNGQLLKLTEWTRAELLGADIAACLTGPELWSQFRFMSAGNSKSLWGATLQKRSGGTLTADLKISAFLDRRRAETLALVQVTSTQERMAREQADILAARQSAKLEQLFNLLASATEDCLPAAVRITREAFAAEAAGLYRITYNPRGMRLECAEAAPGILPPTLGPSEIQFLTQPLSWNNSQRPEALLCQKARAGGWSHLISAPVGETPDIQGALFVAYRSGNPPAPNVTSRLSIAARQVYHLIEQIGRQQKLGDTQRLASRLANRLAAINAQIEEGIVILSGEGTIDEINPAAAQMLGYRSEDISGLPYYDILIADVHITDAILANIRGTVGQSVTGNVFRRGGQAFPAAVRIQPLPECGCVITIHDLSEEQASRQRRELLDNLAYVGQTSQAFAHEVRGPLNNIHLGMQFLQARLKSADEATREAIGKILVDVNRLSVLMNDMLAWAKPVDPRFEMLELAPLLQRLLDRWANKIQQRNVRVSFVADEACPPVMADPMLLERVFVNLIDNALQAMPVGGDLSLRLQLQPHGKPGSADQVLVRIGDSGPGIPEDIKRRIFDPYFTTRPNGTGLGLAICRRLVTVNRGAIGVESFPGTGTIFTVTLPAYRAAEAAPAETPEPGESKPS
jgi:PAS domain S-box-containing protein